MPISPRCLLVHPPSDSDEIRLLSQYCHARAKADGYTVKTLRARSVRVVGGSGRQMKVLSSTDASKLYRDLHRAPSLVIALSSVFVSIDPSRDPPNRRATRSLQSFVACKSAFGLVRGDSDADALLERFAVWQREVHCDGMGDPRALPLHVFDASDGGFDLESRAGSERFREAFGAPGRREDGFGRIWEKGTPHGRETLQVAGFPLPPGSHWDVSPKRNNSSVASVCEIWKVKGSGYVNVYPNEHIRGPSSIRHGLVRRVWPPGNKKCPSSK